MSRTLTEQDYIDAADILNCEVAAIRAVSEVEAPKGGFLPDGRPTILFERHKFSKYSGGKFDKDHPDISNRKRGGYKGGALEWNRLERARKLDEAAAYKSASWGKYQIMGFNHKEAGYADVFSFVDAMKVSEGKQLEAFITLIKSWHLDDELRNRKWAAFAQAYNGAAYADNQYDVKMARAYAKYSKRPSAEGVTAKEETNNIDDEAIASIAPSLPEPTVTEVTVKDGDVTVATSEGAKPEEKIAIEKPVAQNFAATMRNKIGAMTGGNFTLQVVRDYAEQARLFGLSARFWMWVSIIALIGAGVYLLSAFYKHKSDVRRDMEITDKLIIANSTPSNRVELVEREKIPELKAKGYRIIER